MHALLRPFFQMCLMRLRPQDLPSSRLLLVLMAAAYTICGFVMSTVYLSAGHALVAALVDVALLCGLTIALLAALRLQTRVVQTLTALTGTGMVLTAVAYPIALWVDAARLAKQPQGLETVLLLLLIAWSIAVVAHIMRHAMSSTFGLGIAVAIVYQIVSLQAQNALQKIGF